MTASTPESSSQQTASTEESAVLQLLGSDPWMRFDLWSSRAWEASERAIEVAVSSGEPVSSEGGLDHRVMAMFHSAQIAKEFAEMVNPIDAVSETTRRSDFDNSERIEMMLESITDNDDLD